MSSSTAGPGGSTAAVGAERLQGSLRHSAIARLLIEGRLSSSSSPAAVAATDKVNDRRRQQVEVHSPPPPIDLSTNRTSAKQVNETATAAAASFSLSTITTMEKLRCILSYEIQTLLSRGDYNDQPRNSSSSNSIQFSCRLCSFAVSNVIELLDHYRLHGDTLAHLGHKSPDILSQWFEYYLKTSPLRCSSQSLCVVNESLGVMTPAGAADSASSPASSRLDLRTLLLKPFKATNTLLLSSDRPASSRHRACSESQPLRLGTRAAAVAADGAQSRSSTPYTMISGLTDDENQQQQSIVYAGDRCPRRGPANGRQSAGGVYPPGEMVSVKCEADDATTSPVRSPLSTYSAHSAKDKGPNSQDSQSSGAEYLGQFQNGRLQRLAEEARMAEERSPPTLKCEVDNGSPYPEDRVDASHCFEIDDKYLTNLRDHPHPKETLRKSSNIARLLHPGLRPSDERLPNLGYSPHPAGPSVTPTRDAALDQPEDGQQTTVKQSKSPAPIQFRETVEQEYAYKQYKRLRKSNTPKSYRQETSLSPCHSLSKTPDDSGLSGTPSDGPEVGPQRGGGVAQQVGPERGSFRSTERAPHGYDVGIQCSLISPTEPWIIMTEGDEEDEEDDDEEEADDETREERRKSGRRCRRARMRVRRKRAYPADENEMPDITASDADCVQLRCSPCGITFDDDVIFSIHMGCHSHTDPFVCNICGRPCDNKYAFNTHILRGHHPT